MPREIFNAFRYLTQEEVYQLPEDWSCRNCLGSSKDERCIGHLVAKRNPSLKDPDRIERTGHVFHSACIEGWLQNHKGKCPLCQKNYDYSVVPKQKSEWLKKIKSIAGKVFDFLKRPTVYTLNTGFGVTITAIHFIDSLPLFTLGVILISKGFALAEKEYKPMAIYYKNELDRLKSQVDELDKKRDQLIEEMIKPSMGRCISLREINKEINEKRLELQRWEDNSDLKDQYNAHTVSVVAKRGLFGFVLFILYASIYNTFKLPAQQGL